MISAPDRTTMFPTLATMHAPRFAATLAWMLVITIAIGAAILVFIPWVQTAEGTGRIVALYPGDRPQQVTALVSGKVDRWYVHDGQHVARGDPMAHVVDLDPELLTRLAAERTQVEAEIAAITRSRAVASIDVDRSQQLFAEGLASRRDYEQAQIKVAESSAKLAESRAKLNRIEVQLNRQSAQLIRAPRDGRVIQLNATGDGALVSAGTALAMIAPEQVERAVELYIDGRDVPLVYPGRPVRLEFEGWPAIQFSGWPSVAQGMFDGRVGSIDPSATPEGSFRVLVQPMPGKPGWPTGMFVRPGGKVRGWVRGETVRAGYEVWRQLNDFPLEFGQRGVAAVKAAKPPKFAGSEDANKDSGKK